MDHLGGNGPSDARVDHPRADPQIPEVKNNIQVEGFGPWQSMGNHNRYLSLELDDVRIADLV